MKSSKNYNSYGHKNRTGCPDSAQRFRIDEIFFCIHCQNMVITSPEVSGVKNRNHCPYCLYSKHLDLVYPGDRLSACKQSMAPVALTVKKTFKRYHWKNNGELMIVHRCLGCGQIAINRIAADDDAFRIVDTFNTSISMELKDIDAMKKNGIDILTPSERDFLQRALFGISGLQQAGCSLRRY